MSKNQLVSIVMPLYNREHLIRQTLGSVAQQTYQPFELVIVNDGSSGNSAAAAEDAMKSLNLAGRVITITNRGPDRARDAGMEVANGQYIALLDSDDLWDPSYLSVMVEAVERLDTEGLVFSDFEEVDNDLNVVCRKSDSLVHMKPADASGQHQLLTDDFFDYLLQEQPSFPSALMFKRSLYDRFGTFGKGLSEFNGSGDSGEWDFFLRCAHACPGLYVREPLVKIRKHDANLSGDFADQTAGEVRILKSLPAAISLTSEKKRLVDAQVVKRSLDCGYHYFSDYRLKTGRPYFLSPLPSTHCLYALVYLSLSLLPSSLLRRLRTVKAGV